MLLLYIVLTLYDVNVSVNDSVNIRILYAYVGIDEKTGKICTWPSKTLCLLFKIRISGWLYTMSLLFLSLKTAQKISRITRDRTQSYTIAHSRTNRTHSHEVGHVPIKKCDWNDRTRSIMCVMCAISVLLGVDAIAKRENGKTR